MSKGPEKRGLFPEKTSKGSDKSKAQKTEGEFSVFPDIESVQKLGSVAEESRARSSLDPEKLICVFYSEDAIVQAQMGFRAIITNLINSNLVKESLDIKFPKVDFRNKGYGVCREGNLLMVVSSNGIIGFDRYRKTQEQLASELPDMPKLNIVITDYLMPDKGETNGIRLLQNIRHFHETNNSIEDLRMMILTTNSREELVEDGFGYTEEECTMRNKDEPSEKIAQFLKERCGVGKTEASLMEGARTTTEGGMSSASSVTSGRDGAAEVSISSASSLSLSGKVSARGGEDISDAIEGMKLSYGDKNSVPNI